MVSSTPSRVTRSSSRQPERKVATPTNSRKKKSTSAAAAAPSSSSKKKSTASSSKKKRVTAVAEESPAPASASRRKSTPSRASRRSPTPETPRSPASPKGESVAEGASRISRRSSSTAAAESSSSSAAETNQPLVALIPHLAVYGLLIGIAHILVAYEFAVPATQDKILNCLKCVSGLVGGDAKIRETLAFLDGKDITYVLAVVLFVVAGYTLRWGVALVTGRRSNVFAANLTRVASAVALAVTVYELCHYDVLLTQESLNTLFLLRFAFALSEFLLNLTAFSSVRRLYSIIVLVVTGVYSWFAYTAESTGAASTKPAALTVAISYSLFIVSLSHNLSAVANVFATFGWGFLAVVTSSVRSFVNFGVLPILAVSLFTRQPSLFKSADASSATFLESVSASLLAVALVFLLFIDSHVPQQAAPAEAKKSSKRKSA